MKRFLLKTFLPAFLLLGVTSLIACNSNKSPSSNYDKVKFAFNGVEKSFKSPKAAKKSLYLNKRERLGGSNTDSGLSTIFNLYKEEDKRDDFLDDVEYNQPPMVQFQYLKKVLEKVGKGYEFGTKYFDTVTGDVYLDITTGLESTKNADKFNYTLGLGMDISIDSNDLITADVSFDIKIARGQEEYNTKWYVAIELDYDMKNSSPNYTMTMVTENNETELPYYQHYTYEYDYVEVKDSQISEWRKFCMDNNNRLVKDSTHPNFDSYTGEGSKYRVDACSWYKNGVYYKNKRTRQLNGSEAKTVGQALYADLGLNASEINADAFFNKPSTQNSVLKTCYEEFGKVAKKDVIYSLLTKEEQEPVKQQQKTAIMAMNGTLTGRAENYLIPKDTTIGRVFDGFFDGYGEKTVVVLYYVDQDGGLMEEIKDLNSLSFFFKLRHKNVLVEFDSLDETLESAYSKLAESDEIQENDLERECEIVFASKEKQQIKGAMPIYYDGDLPSTYQKPEWPKELNDLGLPEYDGESVQYSFNNQGNRKDLGIRNTTYEEGEAYCRKLRQNGFEEYYGFLPQEDEVTFKKAISDQYDLYVIFKFGKNIDDFRLTVWKEEAHQETPEQPFHVYVIGNFNNWGKNTPDEFEASYDGTSWTFTLEDFHVNANESFAFVTNVQNLGERYFITGDSEGMFDLDYDRQPYAMKALQDFTATFTVSEDGFLRVEFGNSQNEINFLTIVGDFNGWSETDGVIEMAKTSDRFEIQLSFEAGVEFKIMQNHSWAINYGYKEIMVGQSADMKNYFENGSGEYGNMKTTQSVTFVLTATSDETGHAVFKINIVNR